MEPFKNIFLTESIRQGLPHITTMNHEQVKNLLMGGKIHLDNVTEKTDGMTHLMGHDEQGFYTQGSLSGSNKMRQPQDYIERAKARAREKGEEPDLTAAKAFAHIHKKLSENSRLVSYLRKTAAKQKDKDTKVRGEIFYKPFGKPSTENEGEVKFAGTSYDPNHMGKVGKYVIHTQLPENSDHDPEYFKTHLSNHEINFDDDKTSLPPKSIPVHHEAEEFSKLNHELITSRTKPTTKIAKENELLKLEQIKRNIAHKVDEYVHNSGVKGKWGSGSEGLVVHPGPNNPNAPRFKVTSSAYRQYRGSDEAKNFKKRNQNYVTV